MTDVTITACCDLPAADRLSNTTETYVRLLAAYRRVRPYASGPVLASLSAALSLSLQELEAAKRQVGEMIVAQPKPR